MQLRLFLQEVCDFPLTLGRVFTKEEGAKGSLEVNYSN